MKQVNRHSNKVSKAYFDIDEVPVRIRDMIKEAVKKNNAKVIVMCRASRNVNDDYLFVVMAKRGIEVYPGRPYVVWTFNAQGGGLAYGHVI